MPPLINAQWEKFSLAIFSGKNQAESAIEAGYKPKAARQVGNRLLTYAHIKTRLMELQEAVASAKIMNKRERQERLSEIARETIEGKFGVIRQGNLQAIAELNKMEGAYAPAQLDLTSGGKPLAPPVIQVVSLNAKELTEEIIKGKGTE